MTDRGTLDARLRAVERALTDESITPAEIDDVAGLTTRIDGVEDRLDTIDARLDEMDAAISALRGYVGQIDHVNSEVERTATAAVAAVERLEDASGTPPPIATATADPSTDRARADPLPDESEPEDESSILETILDLA